MRLLSPIILILLSAVYHIRHQFSMRHTIAAQLVRHNLPGFSTMTLQKTLEKPLRCGTITLSLQIDIHHLTILIDSPPQIMLLTVDLDEDFVDIEGVAIAVVLSFQSPGIFRAKFDAP